ncbi:hypothetical protein LZ575_21010 [Antarcticibacterium sp. 1MA-6-2]|uniref:hypothetical protein n=1 Tax=Antarcticibacterium sp. 1MA-6-2 TaxID=2908210 RepID=UPI001F3653DA|nr:hypothetical protein [Antarcticibacterium sp. 1MA-6-2]UJH91098.1 hypothetical protein LZ575_21010 [Antarcticibacterium sp. 1MA-6-2]
MNKLYFLLAISLFLGSCKNESTPSTSVETETTKDPLTTEIALANGFSNFENVEQLNFTFNVKVNDTLRSQRSWKWFPMDEKVELTENGSTLSYINDGDLTDEEKSIDQKFINDSYWLLFPYQLMWSDYEFEQNRSAVAPISGEPMRQVSISYTNDGGYTPGDTYHLFLDNENSLIKEWTYESSQGRTMSTTWEDYETFNGITIAQMHKSEDGSFQLYFTDIEVKAEQDSTL